MRVLILGGTGAMGAHLVAQLAADAVNVTVTSRGAGSSQGSVSFMQGNAMDEDFLRIVLQKEWDAIVDFMVYSTPQFKARIALLLQATSHYVYISSARVYANSPVPLIECSPRLLDVTQDQKYLATDEYALSKARQENLLRDAETSNWTIIRPYITYSEDRLQLGVLEKEDWLYRALQGKTIVVSEDINTKATTMTHGLDVARGIQAILGRSGAKGEAFHITASTSVLWSEVLALYVDVLERHLNRRPKVIHQNLTDFCKWRHGQYQIRYDRLYDRRFDNSKISNYLDTSSFVEPMQGLTACLERSVRQAKHLSWQPNWRAEALKDKLSNEFTWLGDIQGLKQKLKYFIFRNLPL